MTRDAYMEQMLYTVDTLEEAIDGAERLSEQLGFLLERDEETATVLGKEAMRFFEGFKIHTDNCTLGLYDMKDDVMQRIRDKRKWD